MNDSEHPIQHTIWHRAPGFPEYMVDRRGIVLRIESTERYTQCRTRDDGRGYECVTLYRRGADGRRQEKTFKLHRLVWEAYCGPVPQGKHIDHINHDKKDNRLINLRLRCAKENSADCARGSRKGCKRVTSDQTRAIKLLKQGGFGCTTIAKLLRLGETTVRRHMRKE